MKNEHALAQKICLRLDRTTEQLSPRIAERLAAARATALAAAKPTPRPAPSRADSPLTSDRPPLWWRVSATAIPALLLVLGVFLVDAVQQEQSVEEIAAIDSALLTDELPLVAYADHGFGVYIKNTRR